jgi:hypothetical protein
MNRHSLIPAFIFSIIGSSVFSATLPRVPASAVPTIECIRTALKSDSPVQSVSLYSIDGTRFAIEYVFRAKDGHFTVSDIELFTDTKPVMQTDEVPRELSEETMNEAYDLEMKLDLHSKCKLDSVLDNAIPQPAARSAWQRIEWPSGNEQK